MQNKTPEWSQGFLVLNGLIPSSTGQMSRPQIPIFVSHPILNPLANTVNLTFKMQLFWGGQKEVLGDELRGTRP